jgi:sialate O-acetylesterase
MKFAFNFALAFLYPLLLTAQVAPDPMFSDGAVLQRNQPITIWGTSAPSSKVTVSFHGQKKSANSDSEGRWKLRLDPMAENAQGRELLIESGSEKVPIKDIVIGEVWLCSGQSNMAWTLQKCVDAESEVAKAVDPMIRVNLASKKDRWDPCVGRVAASTSGVAYYFARKLRQDHPEVPVGLIVRAVGGTPIEDWTPLESLEKVPFAARQLEEFEASSEKGKAIVAHRKAEAEWKRKTRSEGRKAAGPKPTSDLSAEDLVLGGIYAYRDLLPAMISSWRNAWGQGDFRFLVVQLPTYSRGADNWSIVQESQAIGVTRVSNTDFVDIRDLPDGGLHPVDKKPVGERLAAKAFPVE